MSGLASIAPLAASISAPQTIAARLNPIIIQNMAGGVGDFILVLVTDRERPRRLKIRAIHNILNGQTAWFHHQACCIIKSRGA